MVWEGVDGLFRSRQDVEDQCDEPPFCLNSNGSLTPRLQKSLGLRLLSLQYRYGLDIYGKYVDRYQQTNYYRVATRDGLGNIVEGILARVGHNVLPHHDA